MTIFPSTLIVRCQNRLWQRASYERDYLCSNDDGAYYGTFRARLVNAVLFADKVHAQDAHDWDT